MSFVVLLAANECFESMCRTSMRIPLNCFFAYRQHTPESIDQRADLQCVSFTAPSRHAQWVIHNWHKNLYYRNPLFNEGSRIVCVDFRSVLITIVIINRTKITIAV